MTPIEIRIDGQTYLVVPRRDVLDVRHPDDARRLLERIVVNRHDLSKLRALVEEIDFDAFSMTSADVLARAASLLTSGRVVGVRVRRPPRRLDAPEIRPLLDPSDPGEPLPLGDPRVLPGIQPPSPISPAPPQVPTSPSTPSVTPAITSHAIELAVLCDDGAPIPGIAFEITDGQGFTQQATTDADGRLRVLNPTLFRDGFLAHFRGATRAAESDLPLWATGDAVGIVA